MEAAGHERRLIVAVPNFAGVPAFLRGTKRLATLPSGLSASVMRGFASCAAAGARRGRELRACSWLGTVATRSIPRIALVRHLLAREAAKVTPRGRRNARVEKLTRY